MPIEREKLSPMSNEQYHALDDYVSKSDLDVFNKSPKHYFLKRLSPDRLPQEQTKAMILGSAFHSVLLEPNEFPREFLVINPSAPKKPTLIQRNAKKPSAATLEAIAYWDEFEKQGKDKTIISSDDFNTLSGMVESVHNHKAANLVLNQEGVVEQSYTWTDEETGERCKCRPDFHTKDKKLIVDVKTTEDASPRGFQNSLAKFRYHVQAAWYLRGLEGAEEFVFIAVEKKPPYLVAVYQASAAVIAAGVRAADSNLLNLSECRKKNHWPGYSEAIETIDLPKWCND